MIDRRPTTQRELSGRTRAPLLLAGVACLLSSFALLAPRAAQARERSNAELPTQYQKSPFALMSLSVGLPNDGWQLRAKKLKKSDTLWIQDKSVPYSYGHPSLVLML